MLGVLFYTTTEDSDDLENAIAEAQGLAEKRQQIGRVRRLLKRPDVAKSLQPSDVGSTPFLVGSGFAIIILVDFAGKGGSSLRTVAYFAGSNSQYLTLNGIVNAENASTAEQKSLVTGDEVLGALTP